MITVKPKISSTQWKQEKSLNRKHNVFEFRMHNKFLTFYLLILTMFWIKWIGGDGRWMKGRKTHERIAVNCNWCGQINNLWNIHCRYYISNSNSLIYYIVSYGWWWCNFFCLMSVHAFSPMASNEIDREIHWITDDRMVYMGCCALCLLRSNQCTQCMKWVFVAILLLWC